ncbi:MAG: tRNA(Met) cytidine acetyltransferase, partial [Gammaproteobacteria bacterium]
MPGNPVSSPDSGLAKLAAALRKVAHDGHHRRLLHLAGERDWCHAAAAAASLAEDRLWIGDRGSDGERLIPAQKARTLLGGDYTTIIYAAHAGLDVDALAAAAGTLRGGGLLLLLTPLLEAWPELPDPALARLLTSPATPDDAEGRFITRLIALLRTDPAVTCCTQGAPLPHPPVSAPNITAPRQAGPDGCVSDDQRRAVSAVVGAAEGVPAVLTADRGRGKSAALGLAAAHLLATGVHNIVVTAPRRA